MRFKIAAAVVSIAAGVFAASASALLGSAPDGAAHPYVGAVAQPGGNLCSGFLASPTVFVTAAHCFEDGAQVFVSNGQQFSAPTPGVFHRDPGYRVEGKAPNDIQVNDVAVVTLAAPIVAPRYGRVPFPGTTLLLRSGTPIDNVGYGIADLQGRGLGVRQTARQALLRDRGTPWNDLEISAGVACFGDSGGPNLLAGTDLVLAVNSFGPNADCSGVSYSQRLDTLDVALFLFKYLH